MNEQEPAYSYRELMAAYMALQRENERLTASNTMLRAEADNRRKADETTASMADNPHLKSVDDTGHVSSAVYQREAVPNRELQNFRWSYQLLIALAKQEVKDNPILEGHKDCEWGDLVGISHSMYLHVVRDRFGIEHDEYLEHVRNGKYQVDDLYDYDDNR